MTKEKRSSPKEELRKAVENAHQCQARYIETVPVKEFFDGQIAWDGSVSIFKLEGHPTAQICYGWFSKPGDGTKTGY